MYSLLFYSAVVSVIDEHNIPCDWYRGAMADAVVGTRGYQTGHGSMILAATPESREMV